MKLASLVLALCLVVPAFAQDPLAGLHRVAVDDGGKDGAQPHLVAGENWTYPADAVPLTVCSLDDPLRTVAHGGSVQFAWRGLKAVATYRLKVVCLSDSGERIQRFKVDGKVLADNVALPDRKPLTQLLDVSPEAAKAGRTELTVERIAGPNAVVSLVELWSSDAELLPFLTLQAFGDLRGNIVVNARDATGHPAEGAAVRVVGPTLPAPLRATTSLAGRASVTVPSSPVPADVDAPFEVTVRLGQGPGAAEGSTTVPWCEVRPPHYTPEPAPQHQVSLDGAWQFSATPPADWQAGLTAAQTKPIQVPGEWAMQGFTVPAGQAAAYLRTLDVPADWAGKTLILRFDAVYSDAVVFLDGKQVGRHLGGFTSFEVNLTNRLRPGRPAQLAVAVRNDSIADRLASGSQYAAHPLGGITRSVRLFVLPSVYLSWLRIAIAEDGRLHASFQLSSDHVASGQNIDLRMNITSPDGTKQPDAMFMVDDMLVAPGIISEPAMMVQLNKPQAWDPEHPCLYTATITLNGQVYAVRRVAMPRQTRLQGNQILVNGKPIKLHGVCRHEVDPLRGRSLTGDQWRRDAELLRAANVNFVRTSHYPPAEAFLDACDDLGIFVEEEAPFCWASGSDPANRSVTVRQTLEMVARDREHPCVLHWSIANESQWGPNFAASSAAVKRLDPSRPQIFSYGAVDIASWHYPGPGGPARAARSEQPVLFDEYCHLNAYSRGEIDADPGVRERYAEVLLTEYDKMYASPGCLGGSIWAGIDDIFRFPDGHELGYGSWGPLDGWRRPKPEYFAMKKAYSPLRVGPVPAGAQPGQPITVPVENRHDFTDLSELKVTWEAGGPRGPAKATGAPRSQGSVTFTAPGGDVTLIFESPRGFEIDRQTLHIGPPNPLSPPPSMPGGAVTLAVTDTTWTIRGGAFTWTVDRASGTLRGRSGARDVVVGGPHLMLLPVVPGDCATTYTRDFKPFNPVCDGWKLKQATAKQDGDAVVVEVAAEYTQAAVIYTYRFAGEGGLMLGWKLTAKAAVDPRQIGAVLDVAADCSTLSWDRRTRWNDYPADHIGRPVGHTAVDSGIMRDRTPQRPDWPWSLDDSPMGTRDFRASREHVNWAALTAADGHGLRYLGDGTATVRAWRGDGRLQLLVATVDTGPSEPFLSAHFADQRRPLKVGDVVEGAERVQLLP